jgi:hypothetical protein
MADRKRQPDDVLVAGKYTHRVPVNHDGKPICGATKRNGAPCHQGAGAGTDHPGFGTCKFHVGAMPAMGNLAARQEVLAIVEEKKLLGEIAPDADPDEVMMEEVARSQRAVEYFDEVVKEMTDDPDHDPAGARFQKVVWHWNEQRRLLANVSRLVVQAGIAKRTVEIQEMQAAAVLAAILGVISSPELNLDPERQDLSKRMIAQKLRELTTAEEERLALDRAVLDV